jgi:hypothetical protein
MLATFEYAPDHMPDLLRARRHVNQNQSGEWAMNQIRRYSLELKTFIPYDVSGNTHPVDDRRSDGCEFDDWAIFRPDSPVRGSEKVAVTQSGRNTSAEWPTTFATGKCGDFNEIR